MSYVALLVLGVILIVAGAFAAMGAVLPNMYASQNRAQENFRTGIILSGIFLALGALALVLGARGL